MPIKLKRVYETPSPGDGKRVLVERLWPRGMSKEKAKIDEWLKELAPSVELRKWFGHDPQKWMEFKKRYLKELTKSHVLVSKLAGECRKRTVTFVFASKEEKLNSAALLKGYIENMTRRID